MRLPPMWHHSTLLPRARIRNADGSLTAAAAAGRDVFIAKNCSSCHGGTAFTNSGNNNPQDIGTITADSGKRLDVR